MATSTTPTTPKTLLEAVNNLLEAIRLSRVMSLNAADLNEDASGAKAALDDAARDILTEGFEFNTDWELPIDPDPSTGHIVLPLNTLRVRNMRASGRRLVYREGKLYDNRKHTFAIAETCYADVVLGIEFESMPPAFRLYVTAMAARRWCIPKLPAQASFAWTDEVFAQARMQAVGDDGETQDRTLTDTSPHFANMGRGHNGR